MAAGDVAVSHLKVDSTKHTIFNTGSVVTVADHDDFSFGDEVNDSPFSLVADVCLTDMATKPIIAKVDTTVHNMEYLLYLSAAEKIYFLLFDGTTSANRQVVYYNTALTNLEECWIRLCATYDGRGGNNAQLGMKIYLDGKKVNNAYSNAGTYVAMHNYAQDVQIGKADYAGVAYCTGKIKNIRIYNKELSEAEVKKLPTDGLVGWWKLEDDYLDSSGKGHDGVNTATTQQSATTLPISQDNVANQIKAMRTNIANQWMICDSVNADIFVTEINNV